MHTKIVYLNDAPLKGQAACDTPELAYKFWKENVPNQPYFDPCKEHFHVLFINSRRKITGIHLIAVGILDQVVIHAREVFKPAILANAQAIIVVHNHPSGDTTPSEPDIKITRELRNAGQLLRIEVLDHIIVSDTGHTSLRALGYFY